MTTGPVDRVRSFCLGLPEAYEEETWGEATFRVRKKIFCMAGSHDPAKPALTIKSTREEQQALLAQGEPYFFPSYVGSKGWIGVDLTSPHIDWEQMEELITDGYCLTAPKKLSALLPPTA